MDTAAHVHELEAALGTEAWSGVFAKVAALPREQVNAIASRFVARTAASATKANSLQRIAARHNAIVSLARKNEWQRGKGAA